jgi:uncharacterized RDD family membrane protein YckC
MKPRKTLYGQYAGFITRTVAFIVDLIAITLGAALFAAITRLVLSFFRTSDLADDLALLVLGVSHVLFAVVYFTAFWVLAGQTPGMSMTGLRVVRTDGKPVGIGTAILRFIAYAISAILFLGFIWILFDKRRQGWHDKIARTYVIYAWDARSANLVAMARRLRAGSAVPPQLPPQQR